MVKPCASMIASVQPSRREASSFERAAPSGGEGTRLRAPWLRSPTKDVKRCLPKGDARVEPES